MTIRAKFTMTGYNTSMMTSGYELVDGKPDYSKPIHKELRTVFFAPVFGNNDPEHENTKFWNASPSGEIKLGTINPQAWAQFELGKQYYVDFTPAP